MPSALNTLLLVAILLQGVLSGFRGGTTLCFGGAEHSASTTQHDGHDHCCAHTPGLPMPTPVDDHDDGCCCIDIDLASVELFAAPRVDAADIELPCFHADAALPWCDLHDACAHERAPPRPPELGTEGAAASQRLAIVTSTRLLI